MKPIVPLPVLALSCVVFACSDDSRPINPSPWEDIEIVDAPSAGRFYSIAFSASRGLAAGAATEGTTSMPYLAERRSDGTWRAETTATLPDSGVLSAVGFTSSGEAVVAGVDAGVPTGFLLDERNGWSRHDVPFGGLAFASASGVIRLAGSGQTTTVLKSTAPDVWTPEPVPFPGAPQEKALADISVKDDVFIVCGFDDGGEGTIESPNSVVFQNANGTWERIDGPCGGCSAQEFKAVLAMANGAFLLGGADTHFEAGAPDAYTAFLHLRTSSGDWVSLVIPQPGRIDRVNDILIAGNGDTYLACGVESGFILRKPADGVFEEELAVPFARISSLAEGPDGSVWAAGSIRSSEAGEERPALWKRESP
jgi:hypothetical protein